MKTTLLFLVLSSICFGQVETPEINTINQQIDSIDRVKEALQLKLEDLKLNWIQNEIDRVGIPTATRNEQTISHLAYQFSYNEQHEQANWVMHVIIPEVTDGNVSRSNDFREDPLVTTGTAVEEDYFVKTLKSDGKYTYDGFGYDRGHLAPSADFRWSGKALSESYFYSNMSPQMADFNRLKWAELENWMREYVVRNNTSLIIITAPVLTDNLSKIERGINKVSIPNYFVKVAFDVNNKRGIGFVLPHEKIETPLESFIVSIDSVEKLIGYDLLPNLEDAIENKVESSEDYKAWLPEDQKDDVVALRLDKLPEDAINTTRVKGVMNDGRKHTVCGKVVSTNKHNKGHVFINLDKKFPHQVFSISIFESSIKNFDYEPEIYLLNQEVCFTGVITEYNDTPNMVINHGKQIELLNEMME